MDQNNIPGYDQFMKIKDINPNIKSKFWIKVIVLEIKNEKMKDKTQQIIGKDEFQLLIADETASIFMIIQRNVASVLYPSDLIRIQCEILPISNQKNKLFLIPNSIERIGEFNLLYKDHINISKCTWKYESQDNGSKWISTANHSNPKNFS